MISKVDEGIAILSNEGPVTFASEASSYVFGTVYWKFVDSYTLSLDGITTTFSSPSRTVVERNRRRFTSERRELSDLFDELEDGDVFFDVGANTGLYALFAAQKCTNGSVVAFEPYPPNAELLKRDIRRNALDNVTVQELALSDAGGTVEFDQPSKADVGYGSASIDFTGSGETVTTPAATGDGLVAAGDVPQPNIVKIDVEGVEPLVIEGLEETLAAPECRVVYCEIHREEVDYRPCIADFDVTLEDIEGRFEELGFEVEELQTRGSEVFLKARK